MSFMSVLEKVGHDIVVGFQKVVPIAKEVQVVAAPLESLVNPALPALINMGLNAVTNMEGLAAAAGAQNGSGAVKLAAVVSSLATTLGPTLTQLGVDPSKVNSTQYQNFVNGIVQAANAFITEQTSPTVTAPITTVVGQVVEAPVTGAAVPK